MGTLREYHELDFPTAMRLTGGKFTVKFAQGNSYESIEVDAHNHREFDSNSDYVSFYIPPSAHTATICIELIQKVEEARKMGENIITYSSMPGELFIPANTTKFCGRVYFYCETNVSTGEFERIKLVAEKFGVVPVIRMREYAHYRNSMARPCAFICHDSRDKDEIARQVALGLSKLMCPVWYDEYSLAPGARLRESIESGIKECPKCVLILSPNFLSNTGWTKTEFNSVFTKELVEKRDAVVPVWCGITKEQLYDYSPTLVDRVGIKWDLGKDEVVRQIYNVVKPHLRSVEEMRAMAQSGGTLPAI